jgi:hypothetical protein
MRRTLRLASGLVLFTYITAQLVNHALGLVSLKTAESALEFAVEVWSSPRGTALLYGAFPIHLVLAIIEEKNSSRLVTEGTCDIPCLKTRRLKYPSL